MTRKKRGTRGEAMRNRQKKEVDNREKGGASFGILDYSKAESDDRIEKYKAVYKKTSHIDIIPFEITQDWYKKLKSRVGETLGIEVGDLDYKLEVPVHKNIGPENKMILCLRLAFGKQCYCCEQRDESEDEKEKEALKISWRSIYNVIDLDEEDKGVQIFEASQYLFEKELLEQAEVSSEEGIIIFSDLEEGMTITFRAAEKIFKKSKYPEYKNFGFEERDEPYNEDILDGTYPLDKMLIIPDYAEQRMIFEGIDEDDETEEPKERKSKKTRKSKPDHDEDDSDNSNEDDETEKPKSRRRKKAEPEPVEEEDDIPVGGNPECFGLEYEKLDACENCEEDTWDSCGEEKERLEKESKSKGSKRRKRK